MPTCGCSSTARELNVLGFGLQEATAQGSGVNDTELCKVLVDMDISPGKPADKAAMDASRA